MTRDLIRPEDAEIIRPGDWFFVDDGEPGRRRPRLACVVQTGSNYVELDGPEYGGRVHQSEFDAKLRPASPAEAEAYVRMRCDRYQNRVRRLLGEVHALMSRLGALPRERVGMMVGQASAEETGLMVLSEQIDPKAYERALKKAKDTELPALMEEVKQAIKTYGDWAGASQYRLEAQSRGLKRATDIVGGRLLNVSLYGGAGEELKRVRRGPPGPADEKVRLWQRLSYMDEECLVGYTHGGICCESIEDWDRWLLKKANFERLFPWPKTVRAFQVRRNPKHRGADDLSTALINIRLSRLDKLTFLYIRNGRQLFRLATEIEFDEKLFPSPDELDLSQEFWFSGTGTFSGDDILTGKEYQELCVRRREEDAAARAEWKALPKEKRTRSKLDSLRWLRRRGNNPDNYQKLDQSSVYYDDVMQKLISGATAYNHVSLILQGLFDRSEAFRPHGKVKLWTQDGFEAAIELVRDDQAIHGDKTPDAEAYLKDGRDVIKPGDVVMGHTAWWVEKMRDRASAKHWRMTYEQQRFWTPPSENYPPAFLKVQGVKGGKALITWNRPKQASLWHEVVSGEVTERHWVPLKELYNVSAYRPGDFLYFYQDPRQRRKYLKWAATLLAMEEYHAPSRHHSPPRGRRNADIVTRGGAKRKKPK